MKPVYTAVSLALLAAVARAEVHTLPGSRRLPRDLGYGDTDGGHDFMGESLDNGDVVGDTFDHDLLGNSFNHPKHSNDDSDDVGMPSFHDDDGNTDVGFESSPIDSPSGGPHDFNQQGGPDTDSGHNEVDGGVNNDNIVITPVVAQQQAQAVEGEEQVDVAPPHGGPPPHVDHQPEQLPPQQHSEPKQAEPEPSVEDPEPKQVSYQTPAAPAPNPGPTSAPSQPHEESHQAPAVAQNPAPASAQPKEVAYQAPVAAQNPAPASAEPKEVAYQAPAQSNSKPAPSREGETQEQHERPPCPESADGSLNMPMPDEFDGFDDDDLESFPAPEVVYPQATPVSHSESDVTKPFPPGRQYEMPQSQAQVTPQSTFKAKASPAPSSVHHASYKASGHSSQAPNMSTTPCTRATASPAGGRQTPTPTVPSPSTAPSSFTGEAGLLAVPQGFVLAALSALAFLL